ncbi:hypothetical protein [Mycolicibacterium sarraceniae]|uniref:Uncharacterized protein n=1 Tax=Mycolicibacterium sarraceniae TaxID=1534348 RepID=A0A7I7SU16_9MYCO|nr:hypothetical protein [Mycolicibacterium sarraceniae]BBY59545.1 hypothetical protein MSAR_26810 [Mycolicibacterium sarraceniae]
MTSHPTAHFLGFIAEQGQTFPDAAAALQEASGRRCRQRLACTVYSNRGTIAELTVGHTVLIHGTHDAINYRQHTVGKVILDNRVRAGRSG